MTAYRRILAAIDLTEDSRAVAGRACELALAGNGVIRLLHVVEFVPIEPMSDSLVPVPAKLLTRHWVITDANGRVQEVRGDGVVGEQPYLKPGQGFRYSSGAVLETPVGAMQGSYQMVADDGATFDAAIPAFRLAMPGMLH